MATQTVARPVTNGRPIKAQKAATPEPVPATPTITAEDNGTYKGYPMVQIHGMTKNPINVSYKKAARFAFAVVSGALSPLPQFVEEWNKLVDEFGDPSAS
jgi:hypothetical protein